jgi:putative tricarboxylic transport membrane protein
MHPVPAILMLAGISYGSQSARCSAAYPALGPTITTFVAHALEKRVSRRPEQFGHGAIAGIASPEAASHSKTQVDFIPVMSLGIPGDPVMALLLDALLIQGVQPGPALPGQHPASSGA